MRLSESIEKSGFFWLPEDGQNQVPGILRISNLGEVELEVFRYCDPTAHASETPPLGNWPLFPVFGGDRNIKRILGIVENTLITLDECVYSNKYKSMLTGGVSTSTLFSRYAFLGTNYNAGEEVKFTKLTFALEGLDEWLSVSGFKIDPDFQEESGLGVSIEFRTPEDIKIDLPGGFELSFTFSASIAAGSNVTQPGVSQKAYICLVAEDARPFGNFLDLMYRLHDFLCLATDRNMAIETMVGYSSDRTIENAGKKYEVGIRVYCRSKRYPREKTEIHLPEMLLPYRTIDSRIESVLTKWLDYYEKHEHVFNLYFGTKSNDKAFLESRFLSLAQALEALHRGISNETRMPRTQFRELRDRILEIVPDGLQMELIQDQLSFANELTLRTRIKRLIAPVGCFWNDDQERKEFVSWVVDTRNYLTHFDKRLHAKAAKWEDLWRLYLKLEALLQLHFMLLIGLDLRFIKAIVNQNVSLRNKLELEYQEPPPGESV